MKKKFVLNFTSYEKILKMDYKLKYKTTILIKKKVRENL